jgi:DNA-directed RNA polymerase sigma subunit (sigma70/sigma32)
MDGDYPVLDNPLNAYLEELKNVAPLDREEEMECIQHVRAGDEQAKEAGQRLVEANLQLVATIAERYPRDKMHMLHLIQEGNRGLLTAVQTLHESSADNFSIHATPLIERAISDALLACVNIIPRHLK